MDFSLEQLKEIIAALDQTDITELNLESGDLRLNIRKSDKNVVMATPPPSLPSGSIDLPVASGSVTPAAAPSPIPLPTNGVNIAIPSIADSAAKNLVDITSPMVGTFYRSPSPDDPAFVEKGDQVRKGQTICIIEAMKLMNEIEAEVSGRVVEILIENAQPIEYGQVLIRIDPS